MLKELSSRQLLEIYAFFGTEEEVKRREKIRANEADLEALFERSRKRWGKS